MEPSPADLHSVTVSNQASETPANLAQSFQALFASSDAASQLQLLQAMGAMPPTTAPQMVILPASVGNSSGSWPQQYVVVPSLNQFVLATSDASSSSAQAVLLASLGAQTTPGAGVLTTDTSSPHRSLSSPAHMLNGIAPAQPIPNTQPALTTIAENQLSQPQNLPKPPVKPLSAYMSFSKAIWPQVKLSHANASVCEIGAIIGQMWNDLDEAEKKQYNDNYAIEKAKYTKELQAYLQATGLKASDLVKPRSRKGRVQVKSSSVAVTVIDDDARAALPHFSQVWMSGSQQVPAGTTANTLQQPTSYSEQVKSVVPSQSHNGLAVESELRELREAVSNVTREAEYLKRQLDEAFAYIRQLEEQQASVITDLAAANSVTQTPSVPAV